MKKTNILLILATISTGVLLFTSCADVNNKNISISSDSCLDNIIKETTSLNSCIDDKIEETTANAFFPVKTYGVYGMFCENSDESEFNQLLINNPIDKKMGDELETTNISGTRESQIFFDSYVKVWQDELEFSLNNLKGYLTEEDKENLESSQQAWEDSWKLNGKFDHELMVNRGIDLGTQYVPSGLLYLIDQYRDRVFHIKYMTMLAEECISDSVPKNERKWDKFSIN